MLISAVLPIMSLYHLPHGQYGYSASPSFALYLVFSKGLCHNRALFPRILMMSVILLQFTETSSNLAAAQAAKTS